MPSDDKPPVPLDRHPLHDLAYLLCRHYGRIITIVLLCVGAALVLNLAHGPTYTARVRLLVTANPGEMSGPQAAMDHGQIARNQAELLADPGLIRRLLPGLQLLPQGTGPDWRDRLAERLGTGWRDRAVRLGLLPAAAPGQLMAARLSRALRVAAVGDTDVIALSFTWSDRVFAAQALNLIVAGYQAAVSGGERARQTWRDSESRLTDAQARLDAVDGKLAAAQAGGDIAALRLDRDRVQQRLTAIRAEADKARLDRELARRKLEAADQSFRGGGWVDSPDAHDGPSGAPALQQSFVALLNQQATLQASKAPDAARLRAIDTQIGRVRGENYRAVKQVYTARLNGLDGQLARMATAIADDEARYSSLDRQISELEVLEQNRAAAAADLASERTRTTAARRTIDPAWMEVASTRVLSDASPPAEPDWPAPALLLKTAAMAGLLLGLASATVAEKTRRTIDRPVDIARYLKVEMLARLEDYR